MTVRLAADGYTAIGVDIARAELVRARRAATAAAVEASFVAGDMRSLPDVGLVDGVLSWGNSFGYLTPADTMRSLAGMRRALRPGGRLVLESATVAESLLVRGVKPRAEYEFGGIHMTTESRYRPSESRLETDYVFTDASGRIERARAAYHVHTTGEVTRLLGAAGFADVALVGADGTAPYELGSPRLTAVGVT